MGIVPYTFRSVQVMIRLAMGKPEPGTPGSFVDLFEKNGGIPQGRLKQEL